MRIERLVLGLAASTLATFALACSSGAADDSGQDEGATVIEPNGTDNPGKVTVIAPSGGTLEPTTFNYNSTDYPLAKVVENVPVGTRSLMLTSKGTTYSFSSRTNFDAKAGQLTTINAALLAVDARPTTRTLGLGGDPLGRIQFGSGSIELSSDGSRSGALLPATYELHWGMLDGTNVQLAANGTVRTVLTQASDRRIARVQAPSGRDFPSANCRQFQDADWYEVTSGYSSPPTAHFGLKLGEPIDLGIAPGYASNESYYHYELRTSSWSSTVKLPSAAAATPAVTKLARIDVDDVLINSTQPRVKGTYQVYQADAQGNRVGSGILSCSPATKTGVDVLPGKYRVEVSYSTVEAGQKTDVHVIDVN